MKSHIIFIAMLAFAASLSVSPIILAMKLSKEEKKISVGSVVQLAFDLFKYRAELFKNDVRIFQTTPQTQQPEVSYFPYFSKPQAIVQRVGVKTAEQLKAEAQELNQIANELWAYLFALKDAPYQELGNLSWMIDRLYIADFFEYLKSLQL